jgi:hypothetical protein
LARKNSFSRTKFSLRFSTTAVTSSAYRRPLRPVQPSPIINRLPYLASKTENGLNQMNMVLLRTATRGWQTCNEIANETARSLRALASRGAWSSKKYFIVFNHDLSRNPSVSRNPDWETLFYTIKWLVLITEYVFCAVRTECSNIFKVKLGLQGFIILKIPISQSLMPLLQLYVIFFWLLFALILK